MSGTQRCASVLIARVCRSLPFNCGDRWSTHPQACSNAEHSEGDFLSTSHDSKALLPEILIGVTFPLTPKVYHWAIQCQRCSEERSKCLSHSRRGEKTLRGEGDSTFVKGFFPSRHLYSQHIFDKRKCGRDGVTLSCFHSIPKLREVGADSLALVPLDEDLGAFDGAACPTLRFQILRDHLECSGRELQPRNDGHRFTAAPLRV
ncbi:hypothetical protein BRCON_2431 [Candidatus Sumerlaea chitinivorans]|uniref:Uncharacterized protein n=1 Tax=Sumerlaea chitinivorans TaxID=2250252 RepID=A0A2Z4Y7K0_SUMC1|nr:hypothetical protein BRCON_2431 [Candidatus Sumerlaea chitinivorans]